MFVGIIIIILFPLPWEKNDQIFYLDLDGFPPDLAGWGKIALYHYYNCFNLCVCVGGGGGCIQFICERC